MVESRPYSLSNSLPRGQNGSILPCAFGKTLVTQTPTSPVHLPPIMCKGKIEWQDDTHSGEPLVVQAGRSPFGENRVL